MTTRSAEASVGPLRKASVPSGWPGRVVQREDGVAGEALEQAFVDHALGAAPPSSAGWKIRFSVPLKRRVCARWRAAASSVAVWPSWPQACILPWCRLA